MLGPASQLGGNALHGASFTSLTQLRAAIDAFVAAYNENARDQLLLEKSAAGDVEAGQVCATSRLLLSPAKVSFWLRLLNNYFQGRSVQQ